MRATLKVTGDGSVLAFARDRQTGRDSHTVEIKAGQESELEISTTGDIVLMMGQPDGENASRVGSVSQASDSEESSGTRPGGDLADQKVTEGQTGAQGTGTEKPAEV